MKEKRNYTQEMQRILDWCLTVFDKLSIKRPEYKMFAESYRENADRFMELNNSKALQGFKEARRDVLEMIKDLRQDERADLNRILLEKFAEGLDDVNSGISVIIKKAIKRKRIINDEEYRLIDEKVNDLSQTKSGSDEIKILNKLLSDYLISKI